MADPELEAIRARRLQELQMQYQGKASGMSGPGQMNMVSGWIFFVFNDKIMSMSNINIARTTTCHTRTTRT